MWRAFFLAIGVYLVLLGAQCLGIEKLTLNLRESPPPQADPFVPEESEPGPKIVAQPAPWTPWSFMSTGAVVCLYSFTIPGRIRKNS